MNSLWRTIAVGALVAAHGTSGFGQTAEQPVVLTIDMDNYVVYRGDVTDPSRISRDPGPTVAGPSRAFQNQNHMADLVAVNGNPIKGSLWVAGSPALFRVSPQIGNSIADFNGAGPYLNFWEILGPDGKWIGSLMGGGSFPPAPGNMILGGNGAFLGVSGVAHAFLQIGAASRAASLTEDPANRRLHGGGRLQTVITLYPKYRPSVDFTPAGPAVFHEDFSPVTTARPARAGETLIVRARNLGPVRPDLLPPAVRAFKADPPEEVNSPMDVTINGKNVEVVNKIGWPGTYDLYRVDFRVPSGLPPGKVTIHLTTAWIPGPPVEFEVQ